MTNQSRNGAVLIGICLSLALVDASAEESEVAEVSRINGKALVDQGSGYGPGTKGMRLRKDFRVLALEGSTAIIQYDDGCRYEVEENDVHKIGDESPCKALLLPESNWQPFAAIAGVTGLALIINNSDGGGSIQSRPLSVE